jgi:hypothetical protein
MASTINENRTVLHQTVRSIVVALALVAPAACGEAPADSSPTTTTPTTTHEDGNSTTASLSETATSSGATSTLTGGEAELGCGTLSPAIQGDVRVETDEDVRALEGVVCIEGRFQLQGGLTSLAPLHELRKVGFLIVNNTPLSTLAGLEKLETVDWYLGIERNPNLESLEALAHLQTVGYVLYIGSRSEDVDHIPEEGNDKLMSLAGLEGLRRAPAISLSSNDALVNVEALSGVLNVEDILAENNTILPLENLEALAAKLGVEARHCGNLGEPLCPPTGD